MERYKRQLKKSRNDALDNIEDANNEFIQCKNTVTDLAEKAVVKLFNNLLECFEFMDMYPDYYPDERE